MPSRSRAAGTESFAIGLDVGTSAVKGEVISSTGRRTDYVSAPYPISHPQVGWAEQDPDDWWRAVGEVLDLVLASHPTVSATNAIVGLTGQMHTTVVRDRAGSLLRPAILWSDSRAVDAARELGEEPVDWVGRSGHAPIPAFTSAHVAWLRRHEPHVCARMASVSVPKDDIRLRFGAGWATEPSDASAMNLMDTHTDEWAEPLVDAVGLDEHLLPPIVPSSQVTGHIEQLPPLRGDGRRLLGLPVVAGSGDQAAQALALGATIDGAIAISIGTSGAAFQAASRPRPGAFRHCIPRTWLALDSTHAAGLALTWWSGIIGRPLDTDHEAADLPMFLPYLQGDRDGQGVPGTLTDLRATHGAPEISSAVIEGVGIELVRLVRGVSGGRIPPDPIGVGGRAAQIASLRDLVAAGLQRPLRCSSLGPAHGAALLAASAAGWDGRPGGGGTDGDVTTTPDPALARRMEQRIARFEHLLRRLS